MIDIVFIYSITHFKNLICGEHKTEILLAITFKGKKENALQFIFPKKKTEFS